ncbi:MAG: AMP-binding protein [Rhodoferax sp.]|nr:AMP-binding protein [Rhodoferax sp.]MBP9928732.1 AMP-binding protein [Rhodoferax sp.]HQX58466.1 AMP-binding protein [Burkholderiaceae bacterium]HQZ07619.1 AMP-binding protein [Burkholderiaceae bacterium]
MAADKQILDYIQEHETNQKDTVFLTQPLGAGKVVDYTWGETVDQARRMAAHLQSRGLGAGSHIAILSKNCAHFFMAELAIWMAGGTTVAIFPTEGPDTIRFVLDHSDAKLLFVGKLDTWEQQKSGVPDDLPCIALPLAPKTSFNQWDELVARTEPLAGKITRSPDDLAMLIYTSGSTGTPKGAMISFGAVSAVGKGYTDDLAPRMDANQRWRVMSYLPLAHSYERAVIASPAWHSGRLHIFFAESLDTFVADLNRARPNLFLSVPRLWLKFQQGVLAKMPAKKLNFLLGLPIIGKIVGRKVLTGLGLDQVQLAASASAPIPPELIAWYRKLGLNLLEGYGMTEDFAFSHHSTEQFNAPGYVGIPYEGVEVRIGAGNEILIKSPGQMKGYYKRPDLDAESFTEDGFFKTGDMGERRPDGLLKVTGRVKELFKTAKGKYVAPAPIENRINEHPLVELSMVSGVGQPAAYGIVVLAEHIRPTLSDPTVRAEIQAEMTALLKRVNDGVADYERLQMLVIAKEPWSIENGCLTPTMKIKRSRIEAELQTRVDNWYHEKAKVLWA